MKVKGVLIGKWEGKKKRGRRIGKSNREVNSTIVHYI
jgi:hypothetical protein